MASLKMWFRSSNWFGCLVVFILSTDILFGQCSMCRAVLQSEENVSLSKAINSGIIYLMVIPYLLVGLVGFRVYRLLKKPSKK